MMAQPGDGCTAVQAYLASTAGGAHPRAPGAFLIAHVPSCPGCRALIRQALALLGPAACSQAQDDLAAFIDAEADDPAMAAELYPHVWLHRWGCDACAEAYTLATGVLRSPEAPPLPAVAPAGPAAPPDQATLRLPRPALDVLFADLQPEYGALRGTPDEPLVIYHGQVAGLGTVTVSVEWQAGEHCALAVEAEPGQPGHLALTIGLLQLRARFERGRALIPNLRARLLTDPHAPDLLLTLLPDPGDSA